MNQRLNDFISWTGLLGTIVSIFSVLTSYVELKETILTTILVILLFPLIYGIIELRKLRKSKSKIYVRFKWITGLTAAAFLTFAVLVGYNLLTEPEIPCTFKKNQIGIGIGNFGSEDDNFSFLVHEFLKEEGVEDSVYTLKRINRNYLKVIDDSSFNTQMDSLCMSSGLVVTGKIDVGDGLFYSKVRFHNFSRRADSLNVDNDVFAIRNPDMQEFSIDNQAQVLADFIAALILYEQHESDRALALFEKCVGKNTNPKNSMFLSSCHTFMGNLLVNAEPEKAIEHYQTAYQQNSKNSDALANTITTLVAEKEYEKALEYGKEYTYEDEWSDLLQGVDSLIESNRQRIAKESTPKPSAIENKDNSENTLNLPPFGELTFMTVQNEEITIPYSEIIENDLGKDRGIIFYIFKAKGISYRKKPYGVIGSNGELISLPKFASTKGANASGLEWYKKGNWSKPTSSE